MKKILLVIIFLVLFVFDAQASTKFYRGERVPNVYIRIIGGDSVVDDPTHVIRRESDNTFIYCVDPFLYVKYAVEYSEYNYNASSFNLTDEMLDRLNVIAYLGYGYKNHTDLKWYAITQVAIWKELNVDDVYFMDGKDGNRIDIYDSELNELEMLVDEYYTLPSFYNDDLKYTINSSYEIEDLNNVLENYEVLSSNINYSISDNKLYINTEEVGNYEIVFLKKNPVNRDYLLYELSDAQSLFYPGKINDIKFTLNIEVQDGSIIINKFDSEGNDRQFATLEGAVYGIYKNDELIKEVITDNSGKAEINNLEFGNYYVKELTPSIGYNLDQNIYEVELNYNNKNFIVNSYENVIKGDLDINKYYGDENNYKLEDGAIFELYDIYNNMIGQYETIDGKIAEKLDYGDYYLLQKKGIDGYNLVDKLNISIKENKKYSYDLYDNVLVVVVPDTGINKEFNDIGYIFILSGILVLIFNKKIYSF